MADCGHDGHGTGDDGAHEPLVAEREQILEAPSSAGEHDHVDGGLRGDRLESSSDLSCRVRPLDACLGDKSRAGGSEQ